MDAMLHQVRDAGFEGVTNFPTVTLIDGRFRRFLEASGCGMSREVALLRCARAQGLATLAMCTPARKRVRWRWQALTS